MAAFQCLPNGWWLEVAGGMSKHRRERTKQSVRRKTGKLRGYDRILIVCEGEKTEKNYFDAIRKLHNVPKAHVRVLPANGTECRQVVDYAEKEFHRNDRTYEWVFAVFDRDAHRTYHEALDRAEALDGKLKNDFKKPVRFVAIASVPSFELWVLLHFFDVREFYDRSETLRRVRQHLPRYEKGSETVFKDIEAALDVAVGRAKGLRQRFNARQGNQPFTQIDEVVELLQKTRQR